MSDEVKIKFVADLLEAAKQAEALNKEFEQITGSAEAAEKVAKRFAKAQADALKEVEREQAKLGSASEKARELFNKGIGGGEVAERVKSLGESFKVAGNEGLGANTRMLALAGGLGLAAGAASVVVGRVSQLAQGLLEAGIAAETTERQMRALGAAYDVVRSATNDTASAAETFAQREALLSAGIQASADQLASLSREAREYAAVHGGTVAEAFAKLQAAIISNDRTALAPFGLTVSAATDNTRRLGEAVGQLAAHQLRSAPASRTLAEEVDHAKDVFGNFGGAAVRAGGFVASTIPQVQLLGVVYRSASYAAEAMTPVLQRVGGLFGSHADAATRDAEALARNTQHSIENKAAANALGDKLQNALAPAAEAANRALAALKDTSGNLSIALQAGESGVDYQARTLHQAEQHIQNARAERKARRSLLQRLRQDHAGTAAELYDAAGLERPQADTTNWEKDKLGQMRAAQRELLALETAKANETERGRVAEEARLHALVTAVEIGKDQDRKAAQRLALEQEERAEGKAALMGKAANDNADEFGASLRSSLGEYNIFSKEVTSLSASMGQTVGGVFQSMSGAIRSHVGAMIAGREDIGQAAKGIATDVLTSLAQEATVKALFYGATAIAEAFTPGGQAAAAGHAAAAAAYGAAALAAGGAAYALGSIGGSAAPASTGSGLPRETASVGGGAGEAGGRGSTVINVNFSGTILGTQEHVEDAVVRAVNGAAERGVRFRPTG